MNAEQLRLIAAARKEQYWRRWGPYLAERAWGTVRGDDSAGGVPECGDILHGSGRDTRVHC